MRKLYKQFYTVFFSLLLFTSLAHAQNPSTQIPLTQAVLNNDQIIVFATEAAIAVNSYGYVNYQQEFEKVRRQYFTPDSWNTYYNGLQTSGNLRTVITKQLALVATSNGTATIVQQGVLQGRYNWKVQVPIAITYSNISGTTNQQNFVVTMQIERDASMPQGVSIKQFMMSK